MWRRGLSEMMEYGYDIRGRRVLMDMTGLHPDDVAMLKRPPENGDGDGDGEAEAASIRS